MLSSPLNYLGLKTESSLLNYEEEALLFDDCSLTVNLAALCDDPISIKESVSVKNEVEFNFLPSPTHETKAQVASKLLDDLDHLEHLDQWIKEEPLPLSDWLEDKIDLPIFSDLAHEHLSQEIIINHNNKSCINNVKSFLDSSILPTSISLPVPVSSINNYTSHTQSLLQEFETVYGKVEMTHSTLTPPQSPQNDVFINLQPVTLPSSVQNISTDITQTDLDTPMNSYSSDVAKELAAVDELVRLRAESLVHSCPTPPSPSTSSSGSDEFTDDPEWIPEPVQISTETKLIRRKSAKPYDRPGHEDKKSRKKEQNKNAATRYRQKKKAEIEIILSEEKGLQDDNDKLSTEVNDLSREIKYLKGLMRDLFKAKGMIN